MRQLLTFIRAAWTATVAAIRVAFNEPGRDLRVAYCAKHQRFAHRTPSTVHMDASIAAQRHQLAHVFCLIRRHQVDLRS